ncbi:MAG: DUF502 domain-containing protein [Candidatus Omnitrophica bacterium]|nr:DUF502 domain-containing protein [Candidatus Omnitrophota bacterium]
MLQKIRGYFITGLIVILPVFITLNILFWALRFLDGIVGRFLTPYIVHALGRPLYGLGTVLLVLITLFTGMLATNVFFKRIIPFLEHWFQRLPLVYSIYPSIKQLVLLLFAKDKNPAFKKVVLFEYPKKGSYSLGFVTNDFTAQANAAVEVVCIYLPTVPNPLSGFMIIVEKKDVLFLPIAIDAAFKTIISGGSLFSDEFLSPAVQAWIRARSGAGITEQA